MNSTPKKNDRLRRKLTLESLIIKYLRKSKISPLNELINHLQKQTDLSKDIIEFRIRKMISQDKLTLENNIIMMPKKNATIGKNKKTTENMNLTERYSGLDAHKRKKKMLVTSFSELPITQINWQRDLLPEFLWIEFLRKAYSNTTFLQLHFELTETLRSYTPGSLAFLGLISDFGRVPVDMRAQIIEKHEDLIISAFAEPFGQILRMYPKSPAHWLLPMDWLGLQIFQYLILRSSRNYLQIDFSLSFSKRLLVIYSFIP